MKAHKQKNILKRGYMSWIGLKNVQNRTAEVFLMKNLKWIINISK